jgi:deferrochelatase/peroxidase EfeB
MKPVTRRRLLTSTTAVAAGAAAGGVAVSLRQTDPPAAPSANKPPTLEGTHQPGITTPMQEHLYFATFDITTGNLADVQDLLAEWTKMAALLMAGQPVGTGGAVAVGPNMPPGDTGETLDDGAAGLTLTIGFGASFFRRLGAPLAGRKPAALIDLPHFPGDQIAANHTGGDLCVQACANDPQVAAHAIRNLARVGFGVVALRWSQLGYGPSSVTDNNTTPRNLFGFKDGTANLREDQEDELAKHVWISAEDSPGELLAGGTFLAARRARMRIETWDRQTLGDQERFVGRTKESGAPLSGGTEFSQPDFALQGSDGPLMPLDSHVSAVHPSNHGGAKMLRRGYNFVDGNDELGQLTAGLFFIGFVRDPATQFVPVQLRMAQQDKLMEYLVFDRSALFLVPPGLQDATEWWGSRLWR